MIHDPIVTVGVQRQPFHRQTSTMFSTLEKLGPKIEEVVESKKEMVYCTTGSSVELHTLNYVQVYTSLYTKVAVKCSATPNTNANKENRDPLVK